MAGGGPGPMIEDSIFMIKLHTEGVRNESSIRPICLAVFYVKLSPRCWLVSIGSGGRGQIPSGIGMREV